MFFISIKKLIQLFHFDYTVYNIIFFIINIFTFINNFFAFKFVIKNKTQNNFYFSLSTRTHCITKSYVADTYVNNLN
jgi:hypothetical protein